MPLNNENRIWELDAFRGICILGMVIVHFVYDLTVFSGLVTWKFGPLFTFVTNWGGVLFLLLSGICATLSRSLPKRGLFVFGCGMLITAVTAGMQYLGLADGSIVIRFGVLHCLGICMLLWCFLKKLPTPALATLGAAIIVTGLAIRTVRVETPWLFWLGFVTKTFSSADYFPLMPFFGFFLMGSVLGRAIYRRKGSLFPGVKSHRGVIHFLCEAGRRSLIIYLLHQPAIFLLTALLSHLL